jgi:hypothetical protein
VLAPFQIAPASLSMIWGMGCSTGGNSYRSQFGEGLPVRAGGQDGVGPLTSLPLPQALRVGLWARPAV